MGPDYKDMASGGGGYDGYLLNTYMHMGDA